MKGSFDAANSQVRRLMEVLGGSADAYEPPREDPTRPPPGEEKPNPFLSAGRPDHGLVVVDEPEGVFLGEPEDHQPTADDEHECAFGLGEADAVEAPPPLDESYAYHGLSAACGELAAVRRGFSLAAGEDTPRSIQLDSGSYQMHKLPEGCWVLDDTGKSKRYLEEIGNLAGHRKVDDVFVWVQDLKDPERDFGYIHECFVFVKKP